MREIKIIYCLDVTIIVYHFNKLVHQLSLFNKLHGPNKLVRQLFLLNKLHGQNKLVRQLFLLDKLRYSNKQRWQLPKSDQDQLTCYSYTLDSQEEKNVSLSLTGERSRSPLEGLALLLQQLETHRANWGEVRAAAGAVTYCQSSLWRYSWVEESSIQLLALPIATHQDPTQNDIINNLMNYKTNNLYGRNDLNIRDKNSSDLKITMTHKTTTNDLSLVTITKGQARFKGERRC